MRHFLRCLLLLLVAAVAGCNGCVQGDAPESLTTGSGGGGGDAGKPGPCGGVDCAKMVTEACLTAVCNTGQVAGPLDTCVVVPAPKGTACDDGKFCTVNDACDNGVCIGGDRNTCGMDKECSDVICYEDSKSCQGTPANDGTSCTPSDLCQISGACALGKCVGVPKDCTFSPLSECNNVGCDGKTGKCVGTPDPAKDNLRCVLTGDLCSINKTCKTGQCQGGTPQDCSALDIGCQVGACAEATGFCEPKDAPADTPCSEGIAECAVGTCDAKGKCSSKSAANGIACNDHDACTTGDVCASGVCKSGTSVAGCSHYLQEGFETCPDGWTLGGDWQCGTPENVGPAAAHTGKHVIATQITADYHVNQSYSTATADSPSIDLTTATSPMLSFWAWDYTEGGTYDGWNLKVSINGGTTFTEVTTVTPAYPLTIAAQPAWGGDHSADGWQNYSADLTAYAGHSVILRFAFHSDGATVYPGVYIDDVVVAEPVELPLFITSETPLADVYTGLASSVVINRVGGSPAALWSIVSGGVNDSWLAINPNTGELTGTPLVANVGPVSVTIRVQEPTLASNFAEQTFTFNVKQDAYYTSFEGACPDGWTLTGDWQCGVPTNVGPATAYVGTQCLATVIGGNYSDNDTWAATTATSPDIDLSMVASPTLTFRMWLNTEGSGAGYFDGANLQVSNDGGTTYTVVDGVMPAYTTMTLDGEPAWSGDQSALGWQLVTADLSVYAGQTIKLRFAFDSDDSNERPGVYIDDFFVN